jgi:hypothetical protein
MGFLLCCLKILIVSFSTHMLSELDEQGRARGYNINCINFDHQRFGEYRHTTRRYRLQQYFRQFES